MIHLIWAGMVLISVIYGFLNGTADLVTDAVFAGAAESARLATVLFGNMAFFGGILAVAEAGGLTDLLAKAFRPFLRLLFPGLDPRGPAARAVCMNLSANLLGLGNAATPFGLKAMEELRPPGDAKTATPHMILFAVVNTASLQLLPTSAAAVRASHGAANPMDILPAVWGASLASLVAGVAAAKIGNRLTFGRPERR